MYLASKQTMLQSSMTTFDVLYRYFFRTIPSDAYFYRQNTVFIRLNAAAFMIFFAFSMRRFIKGGVYFEITFFKSLTTAIVNRL